MTLTMTLSTMRMTGFLRTIPITVCTTPRKESANGLVSRRLQVSRRKYQRLHLLWSSVIEWTRMDIGGDEEEYGDTCLGGCALLIWVSGQVVRRPRSAKIQKAASGVREKS